MTQYNPEYHHRRSIRLQTWDYRSPGYYFVTICTHQRHNLFETTTYHELAAHALTAIPTKPHAQHVALDEWVVMPNHLHAIIIFNAYPPQKDEATDSPTILAGSLGVIIGRYKAAVTKRINQLRHNDKSAVWQRGYYEHIIRNEQEWRAIQKYIQENPLRWAEDRDNLDALLERMSYRTSP